MWGWVLAGAAAAVAILSQQSEKEDAKRKEEEEKRKAEEGERARREKEEALAARARLAPDLLSHTLVIDSNVWMGEEYDAFFLLLADVLAEARRPLVMFGAQFDEICALKRGQDEGAAGQAQRAIDRVERLQKQDLLHVEPGAIDAQRVSSADPPVLKLLVTLHQRQRTVTFISADNELRIRARAVGRGGHAPTKVIDIGDWKEDVASVARWRAASPPGSHSQ